MNGVKANKLATAFDKNKDVLRRLGERGHVVYLNEGKNQGAGLAIGLQPGQNLPGLTSMRGLPQPRPDLVRNVQRSVAPPWNETRKYGEEYWLIWAASCVNLVTDQPCIPDPVAPKSLKGEPPSVVVGNLDNAPGGR